MGGGGGVFHSRTPDDYKREIREIREKSQDEAFETAVNEMINDKLGEYNARDTESHREHLNEIKQILEADKDGTVDLKFAGSVSKHTYVDGMSDVDVLVLVNNSELTDKSPNEIKNYIKSKLQQKLANVEEIRTGSLSVTIRFSDGTEIQLLPALQKGDGYRVPAEKGDNWSNVTRPDKFASKLTEVNQSCGQKVVPVVKIAKSIIAQLPEDQQLSGYHVESLAIKIFRNYPDDAPKTPKAMLKYFFAQAKEEVKIPIKDNTGQSLHVDDDLGQENSPQRLRMSYTLYRISNRMKNADSSANSEEWQKILGDINGQ
jgi:hypothetical protein